MTVLGSLSLWLTLLLAIWSVALARSGAVRHHALLVSSRRAALVLPLLLSIAVLSLVTAFVRRDFNVAVVAAHSTRNLGTTFTAFAASAAWSGSLLLSIWAFSILAVPLAAGRRQDSGSSNAIAMTSGIVALALITLLAAGHPFGRLPVTPMEGRGLDPALQDAAFLITAPLRSVAFGLIGRATVDALESPAGSIGYSRSAERWLVTAWLALTLVLSSDAWHAYHTADPRGEWSWPTSHPLTGGIWLLVSGVWCAWWLRGRHRGGRPAAFSLAGAGVASGLAMLVIAGLAVHAGPVRELRLKSGGSASIPARFGGSYLVTNMGISRFEASDRYVTAGTLDVERNERPIGLVTGERRQYFDVLGRPLAEPVIRAGIRRGLLEDLRIVLREPTGEQTVYTVQVTPLMSLLWLALALLMAGGLARLFALGE